jgi:hypothetical protein
MEDPVAGRLGHSLVALKQELYKLRQTAAELKHPFLRSKVTASLSKAWECVEHAQSSIEECDS